MDKLYVVTYDFYPWIAFVTKEAAEKYIEENPDNLVKSELDIAWIKFKNE